MRIFSVLTLATFLFFASFCQASDNHYGKETKPAIVIDESIDCRCEPSQLDAVFGIWEIQ